MGKKTLLFPILTAIFSVLLFFFFFNSQCEAVSNNLAKIDSLEGVLNGLDNGEKKLEIYNLLSELYIPVSSRMASKYAFYAVKLADILNNRFQEAAACYNLGQVLQLQGRYKRSVLYCQNALKILEKLLEKKKKTGYQELVSKIFSSMGRSFQGTGEFKFAMEYYQKSLKNSERLYESEQNNEHRQLIDNAINDIGVLYYKCGNYKRALEYLKKSLSINKEINDLAGISNSLSNIGQLYSDQGLYSLATENYQQALDIEQDLFRETKNIENKKNIAAIINKIGTVYQTWKVFDKAIEFYNRSLKMQEDLDNKDGIIKSLNNIGNIFYDKNDFNTALEHYNKALQIAESINNREDIALLLNNIGEANYKNRNFSIALDYYHRAIRIRGELDDKKGMAAVYINIGNLLRDQEQFAEAIENYNKCLQIAKDLDIKEMIIKVYKSFSELYSLMEKPAVALEYYKQYNMVKDTIYSLAIHKQISELQIKYETENKEKEIDILTKDKSLNEVEIKKQKAYLLSFVIVFVLIMALGVVVYRSYRQKKKDNRLLQAQNIEINRKKEEIQIQSELLAGVNRELEKLSIVARETDSGVIILDAKGNFEWINEGLTRMYGFTLEELIAEKGANIAGSSFSRDINEHLRACLEEKKTVVYYTLGFTKMGTKIWSQNTLTPILDKHGEITKLIVIDSDITKLKEAEQEIQNQKEELESQSELLSQINTDLEKKNLLVTDSIEYAKKIQEAILPSEEIIRQHFPELFIFFRPRDVVSGDFYWFSEQNNKLFFAVVDCTGHGVPGAFMSMIGTTLLNEIVNSKKIFTPSEILEELYSGIIYAFTRGSITEKTDDGMNVSLCCIDKKNKSIRVAATNQTLVLFADDQKHTIDGTRYFMGNTANKKFAFSFTDHEIKYKDTASVYLFSDGFQDQFGGENNRKFLFVNFENLLTDIHTLPLPEQEEALKTTFNNWKQIGRQIDDVTVVGIKV